MTAPAIDLIVKFGGSAITDKGQFETLDEASLANASKLIKDCLTNQLTCVVVHGAGSFGHHQAKQFNVNGGWIKQRCHGNTVNTSADNHTETTCTTSQLDDSTDVKQGFCLTRQSVTKLHHIVTSALIEENIPAVGISVCGTWQTEAGKLQQYDISPVLNLLTAGLVPVLHGDCVLDISKGCAILSGDTIIQTLCDQCSVRRVVFLSSVEGVYSTPPHLHSDASLLNKITVTPEKIMLTENERGESQSISSSCHSDYDVTGGMTLKLQTAADIVCYSEGRTQVFICKIGSNFASQVCRYGNTRELSKEGTAIHFSDSS